MRELFSMWRNTRMIVLTAVSAAAYVAVLLPFKGLVLVPGLTEVRPGAAAPIVLSFLFGPAAAWGAAFGNLIADVLGGMLTPGSLFGFLGNLLYGYLPYALWRAWFGAASPVRSGVRGWLVYALILVVSCLGIGVVIGWGVDLLGLAPFAALGTIIAVNNFLAAAALATVLLGLLYNRVEGMGLLYHQIMDDASERPARRTARLGAALCVLGVLAAFAAGVVISGEVLGVQYGAAGFVSAAKGSWAVAGGMLPGLLLLCLGAALL